EAGALLFARLFALEPSLRRLFLPGAREQGRIVMQAAAIVIRALKHIEPLLPVIEDLGRRHSAYAVVIGHYDAAREALLWALEHTLGEKFTAEVRDSWIAAYHMVATAMRAGAGRN